MKSTFLVLWEQIRSYYLIRRLSVFELKSEHSNNYLGFLWEVINPAIQIGIYYFVFGFGIRRSERVDLAGLGKVPFFYWMLAGIVVWFFVNQAVLLASKSIYTRIGIMSRMSFPMSVIPSVVIATKFYQHLVITVLVFILLQFTHYHATVYLSQILYFMFALNALVLSFSLITSTLATIVRDVQMVVQSLIRVLMYLTPILWQPNERIIQFIFKINPLTYVVEGYRYSLLGGQWYFINHLHYTLYFWAFVVVMFILGSMLHVKFRTKFVDYL